MKSIPRSYVVCFGVFSATVSVNYYNLFHMQLLMIFKFDLMHVHTTKNALHWRVVTCFRDVAIHIIAVSKRYILRTKMLLWFFFKCWSRNTETNRFESETIVCDDEFYHDVPVGQRPTDFLNCVNTTDRRKRAGICVFVCFCYRNSPSFFDYHSTCVIVVL